jgi:prephenate dehydratase
MTAKLDRIAFLGPRATFTEEALQGEADLAAADHLPFPSMNEALAAVENGSADAAIVPIENAIEGTVNQTLDALIFDHELIIQREIVKRIAINLLTPVGLAIGDVERVLTIPVAHAQCREWLLANAPRAEFMATNSTADAARIVGERAAADADVRDAAIGPALSAEVYGLVVAAADIEDHPDNATRFVLVRPKAICAPTGHDKTSIVCFQRADTPGSLHSILSQFSARNINLTKLESRPTKAGLGNYCFIIDFEGHIDDEVVFDCLRDLRASLADLKFLGSYPAAGEHGPARRLDAEASWRAADAWVTGLRGQIER